MLHLDPTAGLISYQKDNQLWLNKADLSGEPLSVPQLLTSHKPNFRLTYLFPQARATGMGHSLVYTLQSHFYAATSTKITYRIFRHVPTFYYSTNQNISYFLLVKLRHFCVLPTLPKIYSRIHLLAVQICPYLCYHFNVLPFEKTWQSIWPAGPK